MSLIALSGPLLYVLKLEFFEEKMSHFSINDLCCLLCSIYQLTKDILSVGKTISSIIIGGLHCPSHLTADRIALCVHHSNLDEEDSTLY